MQSVHYRLQMCFDVFLKVSSIFTYQCSSVYSGRILHLILEMGISVILPPYILLRSESKLLSK
jgi:hypothetical protein